MHRCRTTFSRCHRSKSMGIRSSSRCRWHTHQMEHMHQATPRSPILRLDRAILSMAATSKAARDGESELFCKRCLSNRVSELTNQNSGKSGPANRREAVPLERRLSASCCASMGIIEAQAEPVPGMASVRFLVFWQVLLIVCLCGM